MVMIPTFADVRAAAERIAGAVHRTPVVTSATFDAELEASVFWKCENLQKVGAFKARGAANAVLALPDDVAAHGVVTHSSGNHGAALAYAAANRGIPAHIVMPRDASPVKVEAVRGYGADIVFSGQADREEVCAAVQADTGATLVPPFDHPLVVAGQATAALELLEEVPDLDVVMTPIGGGGLLSGAQLAVTGASPGAVVVGAEPIEVDDAARSLVTGIRQPRVPDPDTIADGLLTGIGEIPFAILSAAGVEVVTVSEEAIVTAARDHLERMKLVVEPSGATVLAALRTLGPRVAGRRIGAVLSGGNTDFAWLRR
jgi:threonine dehydratase